MTQEITRRAVGALAIGLAAPAIARAQSRFPDRPIRMIVPWTAGGTTDVQMRALCDIAGRHLGQPIVIDNRAGAAGTLGALNLATEARPDGYTLSQMPITVFRIPYMTGQPRWNPETDFSWVIHLTEYTFGVVVRADGPIRDWRGLIDFARANPGRLSYGTPGANSTLHITMEQIAGIERVEFTHVPFRGVAENLTNLLSGTVMATADSSGWGEMVRDGRVRLLNTWGRARASRFPDAPTLQELGYDIVSTSPYGIAGPRGMDPAVVKILHDAFEKALKDPAHVAVLDRLDQPVMHLDPAAYADFARRQVETERALIQRLNLRI